MKQELFEQHNSLQLRFKNKENKKENTNISVRNNSNCRIIHKHNKAMFFMSPQEVSYTNVSKSVGTLKRSKLISKCWHENKFLLQTFNSNDSSNVQVMTQGNIYNA